MGCLFRILTRVFLLVAAFAVVLGVAMYFSPRPGALIIRTVFERGTRDAEQQIASLDPNDVTTLTDIPYRDGDGDALLNVSYPDGAQDAEVLPTVVWIHGGAWVSGSKDDYGVYHRLIAAEGFTVVSIGYSLAPESSYPTPLLQINQAFRYLQDHAAEYHIDVDRFVLAGDSAGAQIGSQIAAIITNPDYAAGIGIAPTLAPEQVRGVILYCGIFDIPAMIDGASVGPRILRLGARTVIWAYTGSKDSDSAAATEMSTINAVTADFPATFIGAGNDDPLTNDQSVPMAETLDDLGVPVTTVFFDEDHEPKQGHEFQFRVDTEDGQATFETMIDWLDETTSS